MDLTLPTELETRDWDRDVDGAPLRMAVVGLGWFGRDVALPAIEESDYCEPMAFVTGSPKDASGLADEYDVDHVIDYDEYADGDATDAYDAVYVVTPNALHLDHVRAAADHGKDVLCEKPLEVTGDRAETLIDHCEEAGVELMTAYRMQTTRSVRWLRDRLREGIVGDPVQVHSHTSFDLLSDGDTDQWRLDADLAGGGALYDIGVYPLNTTRFLLDADPVSLSASTSSTRPTFDEVDEHVAIQAEFPDGVTGSWTASFGAHGTNRIEIVGTEGTVTVEPIYDIDATRTITVERDDGEASFTPDEPPEVVEEFDYFATGVLGDLSVEPDGEDGLFDVRACEAVYESDEDGQRVEL